MEKLFDLFFNGFSISGIVIAIYFLFKKLEIKYVNTFFIRAWLVVIIIQITFYLSNINLIIPSTLAINYYAYPLSLLLMPFFYLTIVDLTKIRKIKPLEIILHITPYLLYVGYLTYVNFSNNQEILVKNGFLLLPSGLPMAVYLYRGIPLAISGFMYSILCLLVMARYKKNLKKSFSNTDKQQLIWINYLVWTIIVLFILVYLAIISRTRFNIIEPSMTFKLVNIFLFFFLLAFGYKYHKQLIFFIKNNVELPKLPVKVKYVNSSLNNEEMKKIEIKLSRVMHQEKLYLDEYLTLQKVADITEESPQYISQTLSVYLHTNFYDYVNEFRLNLVETKLKDPQFENLTIIGIAMDSGFKSKSTFYKLFKKKNGITPAEFRK